MVATVPPAAKATPRSKADLYKLAARHRAASMGVAFFLSDTAAYTASKLWDDVLGSHIFGLAPLYYCGPSFRPCTPIASFSAQLAYSVCLLVVGAAVQQTVGRKFPASAPTLFSMIGMLIGWAFGRAFQQLFLELKHTPLLSVPMNHTCSAASAPAECDIFFELGWAFLVSVGSVFFISVLQPLARENLLRSLLTLLGLDPKQIHHVARLLQIMLQLLAKGAATVAMILWNAATSAYVLRGVDNPSIKPKILLLYSLAITFGGAAMAVASSKRRRRLLEDENVEERSRAALTTSGKASGGDDGDGGDGDGGDGDGDGGGRWRRNEIQFLAQLEGTLGWQAGCAWTDYVVALSPSFEMLPRMDVLAFDCLESLALTLIAVVWVSLLVPWCHVACPLLLTIP